MWFSSLINPTSAMTYLTIFLGIGTFVAYKSRNKIVSSLKPFLFRDDLVQVHKNLYELKYYHRGKPYKIYMVLKRGPSLISKVRTQSGQDITSVVMPILGPNQDFHSHFKIPKDAKNLQYISRHGTTCNYSDLINNSDQYTLDDIPNISL